MAHPEVTRYTRRDPNGVTTTINVHAGESHWQAWSSMGVSHAYIYDHLVTK